MMDDQCYPDDLDTVAAERDPVEGIRLHLDRALQRLAEAEAEIMDAKALAGGLRGISMSRKIATRTYAAGAAMERGCIKRYLRRLRRSTEGTAKSEVIDMIIAWVEGRKKRYTAKPGGLGRPK